MKMKRKFYAIVLSAAMLLIIGSVGAANVFASGGNYHNSKFSFGFPPRTTTTQYTAYRPKDNNTSAWMKATSWTSSISSPSYTASVVKVNKSNFSRTWYVTFTKGSPVHYIKNYAYEDYGYGINVRIKGVASSIHGWAVSGVWSPDSI